MKFVVIGLLLLACSSGPVKVKVGKDQCDFCRMTIMEENFAGEIVTAKGKVYMYDDLSCLLKHNNQESKKMEGAELYIANYLNGSQFLKTSEAFYVKAAALKSPMAGNVAALAFEADAESLAKEKDGQLITLDDVLD